MEVTVVVWTEMWLGTRLEAVAWLLVNHPARGLGLLVAEPAAWAVPATRSPVGLATLGLVSPIPVPVGTAEWQARQSAPLVLLITRK